MDKSERKYYLAIVAAWCNWEWPNISKLLEYFGDVEEIWRGDRGVINKLLPENITAKFEKRGEFSVKKMIQVLEKYKIGLVSFEEEEYPQLLKEIVDPPVAIYYRGNLMADEMAVGIVGARRATDYGHRMTDRIAGSLASRGVSVVSGLALGIDGYAHKAALNNNGRTIAVVAHGLDYIYPVSHTGLAKEILENGGAIISEYPPKTEALKHHFLARNRIIAGLSIGTIVVEAAEKSGALVTSKFALEYGRAVFAVPGDAERLQSLGTNNLIKKGAIPVTCGEDVLEEIGVGESALPREINLDGVSGKILENLDKEPKHVDELAAIIEVGISELGAKLMEMELEGLVKNAGGMRYYVE